MTRICLVAASLALVLAGCGKKDDDKPATTPEASAAAAKASEASAQAATEPASPAAGAADSAKGATDVAAAPADLEPIEKIGVPACDDFVEKVMACINKERFPPARRDTTKKNFRAMVEQWKQSTNTTSLAKGCEAAMESAKKQYSKVGCEF